MKFTVVSEEGFGLGLAMRLEADGHNVIFHSTINPNIGQGLVSKGEYEEDTDVIIFDSNSFGKKADEFRKMGKRVVGSSLWAKTLEDNKEYAQNVLKINSWPVNGISDGVNLYITVWFNGSSIICTYASIVYRRLMSGGRGPDVSFTGVLSDFWQPTDIVSSKIFKDLEPMLKRINHKGPFHVHLLIKDNDFCVLDISAAFNHPLTTVLFENTNLSASQIILSVLDENSKPIKPLERWSGSILVSVPPFPYLLDYPAYEIDEIHPLAFKHIWMVDVLKEENGFKTSGMGGRIGYVMARGKDQFEVPRRIYKTISNMKIRDLQFRNDVGKDLYNLIDHLERAKWIKSTGK